MAQTLKQQLFQQQVDAIDPALALLTTEAFRNALAGAQSAAAAVDSDMAPAARAYLANLGMMQSNIDSLQTERDRLNTAANPPASSTPAAPSSKAA